MEQSAKRIKLDNIELNTEVINCSMNPSTLQIVSILSDDFTETIATENIYASSITDKKSTSEIILEVNKLLPVATLQHLKRVKKKDIILCPVKDVTNLVKESETFFKRIKHLLPEVISREAIDDIVKALQDLSSESNLRLTKCILSEYLKCKGFTNEMIEQLTSTVAIFQVPSIQPKLRWQHTIAMDQWPCKFHLNKQYENLYNNNVFNENEKNFHIKLMNLSLFISSNMNDKSVGVIVDPRNGHIVAVSESKIDLHPLMHCSMVLIDLVARSQNGGAWNNYNLTSDIDKTADDSYNHNGIDINIKKLICTKFSVKFGAQKTSNSTTKPSLESYDLTASDNLAKYGPYICTGYDVYLTDEPCMMCAMALIHSRARRVFFHRTNRNGALKTLTKLHAVKALNHHYDVYQLC